MDNCKQTVIIAKSNISFFLLPQNTFLVNQL